MFDSRRIILAVSFAIVAFCLVALAVGCAGNSSSSSAGSTGGGGGGGSVGDEFCFSPSSAYCEPGDTVTFVVTNGTAPYQFGYVSAGDVQSYDDVAQMQATFNSNTGAGSYTVGPNDDCTDRLAAQDSLGALCYLTVTVSESGGGTPPPPPPPGGGSGGTGGATGYVTIANGYSYCPDTYDGTAWPLVLLLHGMGGTADYFISEYKWAPTARTHKFLLCSLQSQSTYWGSSGDETNLLNMISWMKSKYNVRLDKIVIFGFSNGATYAWGIGFKYPDIFKAIIACSNNGNTALADDDKKVPCYVMWGALESTHPGENTANTLIGRGWDVTTRQHSSGHTVLQNEIPTMGDWLNAKIP